MGENGNNGSGVIERAMGDWKGSLLIALRGVEE